MLRLLWVVLLSYLAGILSCEVNMSGWLRNFFSSYKMSASGYAYAGIRTIANSTNEFVDKMKHLEDIAVNDYGFQRGIITAQIALETAKGKKVIGNNLFNIKATDSWIKQNKPIQKIMTWEVINGQKKSVLAKFRDYASFQESLIDYINLISKASRYGLAWANRGNYKKYFYELYKGGYATDPRYATKLIDTFESLGFG